MSYDRRQKLLAAAKLQMRENDVEYTPPRKKRVADADGFQEGERSAWKSQRNLKHRVRRAVNQNIRNEVMKNRQARGSDWEGRDWTPMPEGTLVQFTKDLSFWNGTKISKNDIATVISEFEADGKRFVELLIGARIETVSKGSIREL